MILDLEESFTVGEDTFFDSISPTTDFGVTFEDDLTTGYFYAVKTGGVLTILDGLHIYDVENVIDKDKICKIQIVWSDDGLIASLLINNFCHAIFDFENKAGYCRNGFPDNRAGWIQIENRVLTDELINALLEGR